MRLIDADVMHREIAKYDPEGRMSLKNIKRYIDAQPTAYDKDKIIEQLEELKETAYESYGLASGAYVAMCNAIEIVKRGGVK